MKSIILFASAMVAGTQAIGTQWWGRSSYEKPEIWEPEAPDADTFFGLRSLDADDFGFGNIFGRSKTGDKYSPRPHFEKRTPARPYAPSSPYGPSRPASPFFERPSFSNRSRTARRGGPLRPGRAGQPEYEKPNYESPYGPKHPSGPHRPGTPTQPWYERLDYDDLVRPSGPFGPSRRHAPA